MALELYGHPFSSYCMKVIVALYEKGATFSLRILSPENPQIGEKFAALWPMEHMPLLVDDGVPVPESSIIIEHLDLTLAGRRMVPENATDALAVRFWDRAFDNYVMTPMQRIVFDFIRPPEARDAQGVADQRMRLTRAYRWLETRLPEAGWAADGAFTLADCAAAPALLYADWVHPIPDDAKRLRRYRERLLARPSVARVVDEARPYRHLFPLGAPARD